MSYAHIEALVTFLLVNLFGFWVITRYRAMRFGRKLEETFLLASRTFLNQHFRDQTAGKPQRLESNISKKQNKNASTLKF